MAFFKKATRVLLGSALAVTLLMAVGVFSSETYAFPWNSSPTLAFASEDAEDASFVYVASPALMQGEEQTLLIGVGAENARWDSAVLHLETPSGSSLEIAANEMLDNAAVFVFAVDEIGAYTLKDVEAFAGDESALVSLDDPENPCAFTVAATGGEVQALAEASAGEAQEVAVYTVDEEGSLAVTTELSEDTLTIEGAALFSAPAARASASDFIVGVDPGHGGHDGGASAFGLKESDVTWNISNYCKDYLEANNVEVVMTRSQNECPGLAERVERAVAGGANIFVSIHINAATNESAHGAEVWYPNGSSYRYELHEQGAKLSANILEKLVALGLTDRGIKVKDATDEYYYPDDSLGDYYTVIAESREKGIVGIIVEHAFITNEAENAKIATPSFQQTLGYADARGILQTYGFKDSGMPFLGDDVQGEWKSVDGHWCFIDKSGQRVTGMQVIDQQRYYFDTEGYVQTGWITVGGIWYYGDSRGILQVGWQTINNQRYYFNPETACMVTGLQTIGDASFVFGQQGACITGKGWKQDGDTWYYLLNDDAPALGWRSIGGHWYYFDTTTARMVTGWETINGSRYYFTTSGAMCSSGWRSINGTWYYFERSGAMATGWKQLGGTWYYLKPGNGAMAIGWENINGAWYYFTASGAMCNPGWRSINGTWYYFEHSGAMAQGWKQLGGTWYYLKPGSGDMAIGWASVNGTWYYFTASGAMCSPGWRAIDGTWYYFEHSGAMAQGWKQLSGTWYYLKPGSGAMAIGWENINGTWYYFTPSGAMCSPGWQMINGAWYYFESSGAMATGWKTIGGLQYYLAPADGHMVTGTVTIDGHVYAFNASGVYVEDLGPASGGSSSNPQEPNPGPGPNEPNGPSTPTETKRPIMGDSQATVAAMASYYRSTGKSYPAYKYTDKGAPTLEDFCQLVLEEANAEGVRAEVIFCQAMKETGWLQFGGTVDKDGKVQCNFAGIGAVTATPGGATFANVREGLRAQAQHLKAYASTEPLNNACVDPRFTYVTRGIAPNLEDLNGRWAVPGDGYGESIASMIEKLLTY